MSLRNLHSFTNYSSVSWLIDKNLDGFVRHNRKHDMPHQILKMPLSIQLYFDQKKGIHLYLPREIGKDRVTYPVIEYKKIYGLVIRHIKHDCVNQDGDIV